MGHSHNHGHDHGVMHFRWCKNPHTCFCEVNRYLLAMSCGLFFGGVVQWLARKYAGSYGAEGDAWHIISDGLFMFVSACLALWKHYEKDASRKVEILGGIANTVFLFLAALVIIYQVLFDHTCEAFSAGWMGVAGLVGFIGNISQYRILEEPMEEKSEEEKARHVSILSFTKQHVFYDILNDIAVIADAIVLFFFESLRYLDKGLACFIAASMLWTCYGNMRKLRRNHEHEKART